MAHAPALPSLWLLDPEPETPQVFRPFLAAKRLFGQRRAVAGASIEDRASGGDRDALELLLREHAPAVYQLCHFVAGASEGRDVAQHALEKIVINIRRFDPEKGTFRSWALTVARNACRDRLRRRGLERAAFVDDGVQVTEMAAGSVPDPERIALARADSRLLGKAMETLPEATRTALVMFHLHGATYEDIAKELDVPLGTVMTWLHRGRKRLRQSLAAAHTGEEIP